MDVKAFRGTSNKTACHAGKKAAHSTESAMDIAYQLYTSRKAPPLTGQFPFLKEIGYDHIEIGTGEYQPDPRAFRKAMDEAGLDAPSIMVPALSEKDDLGEFIDIAHLFGAKVIIRPWLPPHLRPTREDESKRLADRLSTEAQKARRAGLKFAWHNHDFEFTAVADGTRPIDTLMAFSDPLLLMELDAGWVFRAGADVATELRRFADRIITIHVKDVAPVGITAEDGWAAVGDGVIDWGGLLPDIEATSAILAIVEHDAPTNWKYVARRSFETLSDLFGAGARDR
jgi:sugar phosphate isomerase/epimerase